MVDASGVNWRLFGSADPRKQVKKDLRYSGESVLDPTFIRMM